MGPASHLIFLVEELSMEAFLQELLPRVLPSITPEIIRFQGKPDLLKQLGKRLRAYSKLLPIESRLVVLIDRDDEDCLELKKRLEIEADQSGLLSKSKSGTRDWQILNRVAIEELEAWYFGNWYAVQKAYPRVPDSIPKKAPYRNPDQIKGGTWEAFEREMQKAGYFNGGLSKIEAARSIGKHIDVSRNTSPSFAVLIDSLMEATR